MKRDPMESSDEDLLDVDVVRPKVIEHSVRALVRALSYVPSRMF
jgi:hypothetical protein